MNYSLVIDAAPRFPYQAWHLVHSLLDTGSAEPADIYVHATLETPDDILDIFSALGCRTRRLSRFGDGAFCNKAAQWDGMADATASYLVFLDTDMIALSDCRRFLPPDAVFGKVVDLENPPIETLDAIFDAAGFVGRPRRCKVDAGEAETYQGNWNGGFYAIPRHFAADLFASWKKWALWLIDNIELLRRVNREAHIDQVSFCMALFESKPPSALAPANVNYFVHFQAPHRYFDADRPIALLHYHHPSVNVVGMLEPQGAAHPLEQAAVAAANRQFARHFNNRLFWDFRYAHFPERGSGIGSRGANLDFKRALIREQGAEDANSVLDVGCGDLEVVKALDLKNYIGVDQSPLVLATGPRTRPDWTFISDIDVAPACDFVMCFEVLIHQETEADYRRLIERLADKTGRILLVSGYDASTPAIASNPMLSFYEPLSESLRKTGKFKSIALVGRHSDVVVLRCET